jgi:hypothetical protein
MHYHGLGVPRNVQLALRLYQDAADRGSTAAMTGLGQLFLFGADDLPPDYEKALGYFRTAAHRNHPAAQFYWAQMLRGARAAPLPACPPARPAGRPDSVRRQRAWARRRTPRWRCGCCCRRRSSSTPAPCSIWRWPT